ncbi:hypothetical protein ACFX12_014880 [Malus domestica]
MGPVDDYKPNKTSLEKELKVLQQKVDINKANLPEITGVEDRDALLLLHEPRNNPPHALEIEQPPAVVGERQHHEVVDGHVLQDRQDPPLDALTKVADLRRQQRKLIVIVAFSADKIATIDSRSSRCWSRRSESFEAANFAAGPERSRTISRSHFSA